MALSLGWHIIVACLGVGHAGGHPVRRVARLRTGDPAYRLLARRWAKAMGVLFAVGAVSGTILSFEMGLLWPGLMGAFGRRDRPAVRAWRASRSSSRPSSSASTCTPGTGCRPAAHLLSGVPDRASPGVASAFFVVAANAWMNQPRGFDLVDGEVTNVDPWAAMFNPATPPQTVHMILAAFMVTGFVHGQRVRGGACCGAAGTATTGWGSCCRSRSRRVRHPGPDRWSATGRPASWPTTSRPSWPRWRACSTPSVARRCASAAIDVDGELRYAVEIPTACRCSPTGTPTPRSSGLDQVPAGDRPPVNVVAPGVPDDGRRRARPCSCWPAGSPSPGGGGGTCRGRGWFLRAASLAGVAAVVALEAGWIDTEVGRQPWIVYGVLRTADAVNPAPGLRSGCRAGLRGLRAC